MPPAGGSRLSLSYRLEGAQARFGGAWDTFGPGVPIAPAEQAPVRAYDFPVAINSVVRPRAYEPFGFAQLRAFANVELVRLAIETRKDQIERLDWRITPREGAAAIDPDEIARISAFWRKPDGVTPFATWLRLALEDLLVIDAPAMERRFARNGALVGLDIVPGDTIHPMVDDTGRRPRGPGAVAYQQVIKGVAWANLTDAELIYAPRNPRPNHNYGLSPVEQIVVTINTVIRRQAGQLAYFSEGNLPAGLLNGPEGWSPDQIRDMQLWLDSRLSGQTAEQAKLLWVPAGVRYQAFKDSPLKDDFDEWLARVVAYAFSLPPTPFIRQMNRGTAGADQDRGQAEGLEPLKLWAKRLIDSVIQDDLGAPQLEFGWNDAPTVDPLVQAQIDDLAIRNGSMTINEVRARRGLSPLAAGPQPTTASASSAGPPHPPGSSA